MPDPTNVLLNLLQPRYEPGVVGVSLLIAAFASYVALDLARRVRTQDRVLAMAWTIGGALVMGSGIWAMHFVGMLAFSLPIPTGYNPTTTFLSWVAAVAVSVLALRIASRESLSPHLLLAGALAMGGGICIMHYTGMAAMEMAPGIVWNPALVGASAGVAIAASAAALMIFFAMRQLKGFKALAAQAGAALVMGAAISGMHYTAMAAASFPVGSVCMSSQGLGGNSLVTLVVLATVVLLSITMFTSVIDARMQVHANGLANSLQVANAQLKDANTELQRIAFIDPLTGIANRAQFEGRMAVAAARVDAAQSLGGRRKLEKLALLFIDLDGFKAVNDSYGHTGGDIVLRQVAQRLRELNRHDDMLARVGGDEFVLLMEDVSGLDDALALANRILPLVREPYELPDRRITLSCSIGLALYPDHGAHGRLMASADAAMYTAKRAGGDTCAVFEPHMQDGVAEQLELQQALRDALEQQQLHLHYQPKVNGRTGTVCGVEALLRWTHPTRGAISPAVFVPIAERFGLILPIGNWVIEQACAQLEEWAHQGLRLRMSINLSGYQLRQHDVVARLHQAMQAHGVEADQIVCEITESVVMEDTRATQSVLDDLLALGVTLSIDDFGTGYSSLAYLRQLRAKELKIDRSFVQDLASNADARAVVDAVVHLARALGMSVVAEGVETHEQRDVLIALGCDEMQGYYFSRPLSAQALMQAGLLTSDGAEQVQFSASAFMAEV